MNTLQLIMESVRERALLRYHQEALEQAERRYQEQRADARQEDLRRDVLTALTVLVAIIALVIRGPQARESLYFSPTTEHKPLPTWSPTALLFPANPTLDSKSTQPEDPLGE
jgi:hypothetical protein